ncbi:MAG TPA: NmrA family NAD(P)-binding protein [Nevskia sp.]|nr:NmrA family NAD(P)-binding protein [Nevskia sp.]
MPADPILVTGATGAQGGATARALLAGGRRVRFLSRDPQSPAARALAEAGAEAVRGNLNDAASVRAALRGVRGVFSVQLVGPQERAQGFGLVDEARRAGVPQFVHSSVTGTAQHRGFPRWGSGYWSEDYWTAKWDIEEKVRGAGFAHATVLRPAFMMDNFIPPKVNGMFPDLARGEIATAMRPDTTLQLIGAADIGAFAAAAFAQPQAFAGHSIDLAAEAPTVAQIAATLAQVLGREIRAVELTPQQALARGLHPGWVRTQEWINEAGYRAPIEALRRYPLPLTPLLAWARAHLHDFRIG